MKISPINIQKFSSTYVPSTEKKHYHPPQPFSSDTVSFSGKKRNDEQVYALMHPRYWPNEDLKLFEGLQRDLKSFENMTISQAAFIIQGIEHKDTSFPVVRGCYHNCSHCFLNAQAPVIRLPYEDYENTLNDIAALTTRLGYDFSHTPNNFTLFYDSDGSQIYLKDKFGDIHEFPELNQMQYNVTNKLGIFDTAGWNPKSQETQARMERFVKYYSDPVNLNEIEQINISLNPFESIYNQAIKQKRKGNLHTYETLKEKYIDMAVNTMHTFEPLVKYSKYQIICRAYPDTVTDEAYDGFKVKDMEILRDEILSKYKEKYAETLKEKPGIFLVYKSMFQISSKIGASARDNAFQNYEPAPKKDYRILDDKQYTYVVYEKPGMLIDLDGKVYLGNDNELFPTDVKLNFKNSNTKPLTPTPLMRIADIKNYDVELF